MPHYPFSPWAKHRTEKVRRRERLEARHRNDHPRDRELELEDARHPQSQDHHQEETVRC